MFVESANSAHTQITISLSVKYHATGLITTTLTFHSSFILSFHQVSMWISRSRAGGGGGESNAIVILAPMILGLYTILPDFA